MTKKKEIVNEHAKAGSGIKHDKHGPKSEADRAAAAEMETETETESE